LCYWPLASCSTLRKNGIHYGRFNLNPSERMSSARSEFLNADSRF
jgi:hypothetical protein